MPVAVACPKCQKKYNLPENMLGKPVKCTSCQTQFKTPARSARPAGAGGNRQHAKTDPRQQAALRKRQLQQQQQAAELKQLGVDGPLQRTPDIFDGLGQMRGTPDPLSNHAMEDPGFGEVKYTASGDVEVEDNDPMAAMFENPAVAKPKKKVVRQQSQKERSFHQEPALWLAIVFPVLFFAPVGLGLLGLMSTEVIRPLLYGILIAMLVCLLLTWIWAMVSAYKTAPNVLQFVLCLFVPFYVFYFTAKHWKVKEMKSSGLAFAVMCLLPTIISLGLDAIEAMLEAAK